MSAEQTPDIEALAAAIETHVQIKDASGVVLCMCGNWMAHMPGGSPGDNERHRAHVAQALAPVLAAAVREALYAARDDLYAGLGPDFMADADIVYGEWLGNRADRVAVDAPEGGEGR